MTYSVQRLLLVALAVLPSIALCFVLPLIRPATWAGLAEPVLLLGAGSFALLAVWVSSRDFSVKGLRPNGAFCLLNPRLALKMQLHLPDSATQRNVVTQALSAGEAARRRARHGEPQSYEDAVAKAITRVLHTWETADASDTSDAEIRELFVFLNLINARPQEAGALVVLFLKPGKMLEIRQQLLDTKAAFRQYEQQRDTFEATRAIWHLRNGKSEVVLRDSLERMAMPDIDLWHHVVTEHTPELREQNEAALWCLQQSSCDMATVALYFSRVVKENLLMRAAATRDVHYLETLSEIIQRWNAGWYSAEKLNLDLTGQADALSDNLKQMLQESADAMGLATPPNPVKLFRSYQGRELQRRDNWCLFSGTVIAPPKLEDYVDVKEAVA